jgi:plasmid stabilization system protein ParE
VKTLFRPQFWIDLEEGVAYLAANASVQTAKAWHENVFTTARLISDQPGIGRTRKDLEPEGIRSFRLAKFPKYLIFYRLTDAGLEFLRVKHGMMNLPILFKENPL